MDLNGDTSAIVPHSDPVLFWFDVYLYSVHLVVPMVVVGGIDQDLI